MKLRGPERNIAGAGINIAQRAIAGVYAYRKEPDEVFEWLERAYTLHDPRLITLLADPLLRAYQSDARFTALCKKMGLAVPK